MNKLHVYTGDGKGKTTAAMGLALRSLGHGFPVLIAQFMKNGDSGEISALGRFENAALRFAPPLRDFTFRMTPEQLDEARRGHTGFAERLADELAALQPRLIVLDELCCALSLGLIAEDTGRRLLDAALRQGETAVTGRDAPGWLRDRADYLSEIRAAKHPFDTEALPGREGIEW